MFNQPNVGQLFKHRDGGYYRFLGIGIHSDGMVEHVMYEHVWPFAEGVPWLRPSAEFTDGRFVPVTEEDLAEAMMVDRLHAQNEVASNKAARKAAEKKLAEPQTQGSK